MPDGSSPRVTPQPVATRRRAAATAASEGRQSSPSIDVSTLGSPSLDCDAQQYWTQTVTWVTVSDAKEVVVIEFTQASCGVARSLAGQFLVFQLVVVAVVLAAVAAVSVAQSTSEFRDVRGQRMIAVAENLASTPIVRDRYADPFAALVPGPRRRPRGRALRCGARRDHRSGRASSGCPRIRPGSGTTLDLAAQRVVGGPRLVR